MTQNNFNIKALLVDTPVSITSLQLWRHGNLTGSYGEEFSVLLYKNLCYIDNAVMYPHIEPNCWRLQAMFDESGVRVKIPNMLAEFSNFVGELREFLRVNYLYDFTTGRLKFNSVWYMEPNTILFSKIEENDVSY